MIHVVLAAWQRHCALLGWLLLAGLGAGRPQAAHGQPSSGAFDVTTTPAAVALPPGGS